MDMAAPLADRLRPVSVDDIVGHQHLLGEGKPQRNIIRSGVLPNMIFYGPSGIGKTTLARIIAETTDRELVKLNGTTAGTADIKAVIARLDTLMAPNGVLLYLDEIQYSIRSNSRRCWSSLKTAKSPLSPPPPKTRIFTSTRRCSAAPRCLSSRPSPPRTLCLRWNGLSLFCASNTPLTRRLKTA